MVHLKMRSVVVAGGVAMVLFASPPESRALFDWLCPANRCGPATATTYALPYAANRISWTPGYGISSTCNPLLPGSCGYGTQAVAASQPAVSAGVPCGACVTATYRTTYRPFLSWWAARPRLLDWATYRQVSYTPCVTCGPASCVTCCPASCATYCPSPCDPCGGLGSVCGTVGASCPTGSCAPISSGTAVPGASTAPTWSGGSSTTERGGTSTFRQGTEPTPEPESELQPTPDASTEPASPRAPMLIHPDRQTAARPLRLAAFARAASGSAPANTSARPAIDTGGWRASHD